MSSWQQIGSDIDGEDANHFSGGSVSLTSDGSIVAIGDYGYDSKGYMTGYVRIYQNNGGNWQQIGSDIEGEAARDQSGFSVILGRFNIAV